MLVGTPQHCIDTSYRAGWSATWATAAQLNQAANRPKQSHRYDQSFCMAGTHVMDLGGGGGSWPVVIRLACCSFQSMYTGEYDQLKTRWWWWNPVVMNECQDYWSCSPAPQSVCHSLTETRPTLTLIDTCTHWHVQCIEPNNYTVNSM